MGRECVREQLPGVALSVALPDVTVRRLLTIDVTSENVCQLVHQNTGKHRLDGHFVLFSEQRECRDVQANDGSAIGNIRPQLQACPRTRRDTVGVSATSTNAAPVAGVIH